MLYTMFVSAVTVLMLLAIGSTLGSEQNCQVTDFVSIPGYQIYAITPHPILSDTFLVGTSNGMHMVAQGGSSALIRFAFISFSSYCAIYC